MHTRLAPLVLVCTVLSCGDDSSRLDLGGPPVDSARDRLVDLVAKGDATSVTTVETSGGKAQSFVGQALPAVSTSKLFNLAITGATGGGGFGANHEVRNLYVIRY